MFTAWGLHVASVKTQLLSDNDGGTEETDFY